jgi:TonB-linked SusC/RagA family outer membrane protein
MEWYRGRWALAAATALCLGILPSGTEAQETTGTITGRVLEVGTRQPLTAAQVSVAGTQRGTVTDRSGAFRITGVPVGTREVRAELIGYTSVTTTVTVVAGETVSADFNLRQTVVNIEEIVVTGVAGQTARAKLPFSVDRLTPSMVPVPASNAGTLLTGKAAGVQVTGSTGRPGAAPSVLLRAPTSINASGRDQEPLYIVDGVILSSSIADIDAMDIASIEIVKGAAAASMYGSRAANGVIQITTNRGQNVANDEVRYTIRSEFGGSDLPGRFNLTQRHQFAMTPDGTQFINSAGNPCVWLACTSVRLAGQRALTGAPANAWNTIQQEAWPGQTYDHVERFFTGGQYMTNYVSVAGRSGATNYLVSYNRQNDEGIMPGHSGRLAHSFRMNVDQSVRQNMTVSASAFYSRSRANSDDGQMFALTRMPAGVDLMAEDPSSPGNIILKPDPFNDNANPLYAMLYGGHDISKRGRFLGNVNASWLPLSWLKFDANVAYDRLDAFGEGFTPKGFRTLSLPNGTGGSISRSNSLTEGFNASVMGQVRRTLGDLTSTTQVRYLIEKEDFTSTGASGSEFTADGVWTISNTPSANRSASSSIQLTRADGFFLIQDLDFRDRYILNAMIRQDGTSRFGFDQRRRWYYRVAGAYRISEEEWFNLPGIDELKARYSIGTAGNTPSFTAQYETYSVGGGSITQGALGNKDLKPEYATEQEFGIETVALNGRLSLDLTYATTTVEDQLLNIPLLAYQGFSSQWQNAGTLESNTYEATLSAQLLRTRDFTWNTRVMFDRTRQEITELNRPAYQDGVAGQGLGNVFYIREGEAIGTFYGFQFAESCAHLPEGVDCSQFDVNDDGFLVWVGGAGSWENGWNTFTDTLGNTQNWWGQTAPFTIRGQNITWGTPFQGEGVDPVSGERTTFLPLGTTQPKYRLGLANTFTWKGVSLYGLLESVQGFSVYNQPLQWATFQGYSGIMDQSDKPENLRKPVGYYDRLYGASGLQPSSAFVDDASFIKLREVTLRFTPGRDFLDGIPGVRAFDGITFTATGRNLLTWTDYDGYDPDVGRSGGGTGSAAIARVDGFSYPNFRQLTLGIELNF